MILSVSRQLSIWPCVYYLLGILLSKPIVRGEYLYYFGCHINWYHLPVWRQVWAKTQKGYLESVVSLPQSESRCVNCNRVVCYDLKYPILVKYATNIGYNMLVHYDPKCSILVKLGFVMCILTPRHSSLGSMLLFVTLNDIYYNI